MAGKHLRRKSASNLPDEGVHPGCMWGVLHFFDLHQRLHFRKMLSDKKSGGDRRRVAGIKIPRMKTNIPAAAKERSLTDAEANIPMEDKINSTNKTSGKAWIRALIAQEVSKEKCQKKKINPIAPQLLRTLSIHHLECNDYVRSDDMTTSSEIRGDSLHSHDSDSSANSECIPLLPEAPDEANALANYFQALQDSRAGTVLAKSDSFPGAGLSGRNGRLSKLKHKRKETESLTKQEGNAVDSTEDDGSQPVVSSIDLDVDILKQDHIIPGIYGTCNSEFSPSSTHMLKGQRDNGAAVYRFKDIKQRIKDVIKESRRERDRISMDGVLHKIPYGCKASQDLKGEENPSNWEGPATDRYDKDNPRNSYGAVSANKYAVGRIRRSRSLTESMDRYSYLVESNVSTEPKRQISERLKLAREDDGLLVANSPKTFGRIFSLPEFESYFSGKDDQCEASHDATLYSRLPSIDLARGNAAIDINGSDKPAKPTPISVLDSYLPEDPISPAKFSILQGSELKPRRIYFEELDPQNQSGVDDSNVVETVSADFDEVQIPSKHPNFDALHFPVDGKHKDELNYVRDILKKYWFSSDELLGTRYSPPDQVLSSSVSEEAEGSPNELATSIRESDTNLDHELLFDLTNEVLSEIYGSSYGRCPWLSRVGSHIGPDPVGYRVLEVVWANISRHLNSKPQLNPSLEYLVGRDFTKNDGWMNIQFDIESVGLDLEALILDDLLDEAIFQFSSSTRSSL